VEGSVAGWVNAAIVKVDDGDATLGSGNGAETRFKFTGSEDLDSGMTVGVTLEVGAGGNVHGYGGGLNDDDTAKNGKSDFRIRHANVSLASAGGKITIGQQGRPSGGANYADVGSTWLAGATNWCSYGGSVGAACTINDASRKQVVRYDSPALGPLSVAVSGGNGDFWDASAKISGSAGDAGYDLRFGYNGTEGSEDIIVGGSVTVGSTGVAATWSRGEAGGVDNDYMYVKLDQSYGDGSVAVYYRRGELGGDEGSLWGAGVAHGLGGGATAYAGYRRVDNDGAEEFDVVLAGVRVTFN
jgi:hypothetical protein